jgi:hypothetical protein
VTLVLIHVLVSVVFSIEAHQQDTKLEFSERFWFYFVRILDTGSQAGDNGLKTRLFSVTDTVGGLIVAGLLISSLSGNFQARLDSIRRGGSPVVEKNHFLILGWSDKIYSVIDQLSEANVEKGRITVVVMADRDKQEMEQKLADKVVHKRRVKVVVRSGSSVALSDLSRVAFERAQAIVVLIDESDVEDPQKADGRIIKTLMAIYNHPDGVGLVDQIRVTSEVMMPENKDIAEIAAGGRAQVIKTTEIISKIILQTARISGLSIVYDELLRFEGNEIHYAPFPQVTGKRFGDLLLDFPNGCLMGVAKADGSTFKLNPPADHVMAADEELLVLAEDDHIVHRPYQGPLTGQHLVAPQGAPAQKPVEHLLVLGWNEKIFPIINEFDNYVGPGSTMTLVNAIPEAQRNEEIAAECGTPKNISVRHLVGEFTSRSLMEKLQPQNYPTVMVLGDAAGDDITAEEADTRAIIALLLLRDFRRKAGIPSQEVCSEILEPKNRELAATTEIHDIVISNETVSMMLAQVTHEPRVRPVLEDLFESEGSEVYLKDMRLYAPVGQPVTFEQLILIAQSRNELAMGYQVHNGDASKRYGIVLNPMDRTSPITPKEGDRLIVMAEDDG